jgi:hypothetical protein
MKNELRDLQEQNEQVAGWLEMDDAGKAVDRVEDWTQGQYTDAVAQLKKIAVALAALTQRAPGDALDKVRGQIEDAITALTIDAAGKTVNNVRELAQDDYEEAVSFVAEASDAVENLIATATAKG